MGGVRPDPGTIDNLIEDAAGAGLVVSERLLRDWHRRGLLGAPRRISLGQGHGQASAVYSAEARALFAAVVRARVAGRGYAALGTIPVWAWLQFGETWADLEQVRRAMRTAVGPNPRRSVKDASAAAKLFLCQVNLHGADVKARAGFRQEVVEQLVRGRTDTGSLRSTVVRVFEPRGVVIVRGPREAPVTVDAVTEQLVAKMRALTTLHAVTDDSLRLVRARYHESIEEYREIQDKLVAEAGPELASWYDKDPSTQVDQSVQTVLLLLGLEQLAIDHQRRRAPAAWTRARGGSGA